MWKRSASRADLSRRALLRGAAGGLCAITAAGLPGCAVPPGQRALRFWNGFTGPDGRAMLRLVEQFNATTSGLTAVMQRTDWGSYYSKLFVAGLGGRAPEVFVLQAEQLGRFVRAGLVRPMNDVFGKGGLPVEDFDDNVLQIVTFGADRYGVPLDVHPMGTYYNARLLEQAGYDAPPLEGEAFVECLERLAALEAPVGGGVYPFVYTWLRLNAFTAMWQWGGDVFADNGARCMLTEPEAVAGFQWCAELVNQRNLAPSPENFDSWIGFRQGRVGVAWHGLFMLADLQKVDNLPWAAAPVAQVGPQQATWGGSHVLCLRPDLEGDQLAAAVELVTFLSTQGVEWAKGGQLPARKSLRQTSEFAELKPQVEFAKMLPYLRFMPQVPFVQEYLTAFDFAVERTLRGSVPAEVALAEASEAIEAAIDRYRSAGWNPENPTA